MTATSEHRVCRCCGKYKAYIDGLCCGCHNAVEHHARDYRNTSGDPLPATDQEQSQ